MQQAKLFYDSVDNHAYALLIIQPKRFSPMLWKCRQEVIEKMTLLLSSCLSKEERIFVIEDEFHVFLRATHPLDIMNWIAIADDTIEQYQFFHIAIGICFLRDSIDYETAVRQARFALHHNNERFLYTTSYEFFHKLDIQQYLASETWERYLPQALKNGQFQIYLQPKVDTQTKQIKGAEALLRLVQDAQEIPLSDFLPYANQNAFIRILDLFVLEQSCRLLQYCINHHLPLLPISVNISFHSFQDGAYYLEESKKIIQRFQIPSTYIEFELSEDITLSSSHSLFSFLNQLQTAGHRIALDDFGSGYASLAILSELPIDIIKLDQSFFRKGCSNKQRIVLQHLISLLKELHYHIVAEGVETKAVVDFLTEWKVDMIQGFYFYQPLSTHDYLNLLSHQNTNSTNDDPMI